TCAKGFGFGSNRRATEHYGQLRPGAGRFLNDHCSTFLTSAWCRHGLSEATHAPLGDPPSRTAADFGSAGASGAISTAPFGESGGGFLRPPSTSSISSLRSSSFESSASTSASSLGRFSSSSL